MKTIFTWIASNWERVLFSTIGLFFFYQSVDLLLKSKITDAGIVFGIGFLSFIFSNVARFKRFKGLGFEAELWEDKQKEAADLIEKLRNVVTIYTHEIVLGNVKSGRWGSAPRWRGHWQLYEDLVQQHSSLGQKIDFSSLKKSIDDYFLFDITAPLSQKIRSSIIDGISEAREQIDKEFGSPIKNIDGHNSKHEIIRDIKYEFRNSFEIAKNGDLAAHVLCAWKDAKEKLEKHFNVKIHIDEADQQRLQEISNLFRSRPVVVTEKLINWADRTE